MYTMRKFAILFAAALMFGLAPYTSRLGIVGGSMALVALGVWLAIAASGGVYAFALAGGAAAAFAGSVMGSISPTLGGAILVSLAYAERTSRVRGMKCKTAHVLAGFIGGSVAGMLVNSYLDAPSSIRIISIVVSSTLVALPMLFGADDAVAHSLENHARAVSEPATETLREAANLRRHAVEMANHEKIARSTNRIWFELIELAEARVRLEKVKSRTTHMTTGSYRQAPESTPSPAITTMDRRLADQVNELSKIYASLENDGVSEMGKTSAT